MKRIVGLIVYGLSLGVLAGEVSVKGITAQQRYPWNGLVDIVVTIQGNADDMNVVRCMFTATNNATSKVVPVMSVTRVGADSIAGDICKRRYLWNAANDVGAVKIDDLALTVDASVGVQLWENGPCWAECNVGASHPEEYGYYFWWGDTVGYKRNSSNDGWISVKDGAGWSFSNCPTYYQSNSQLLSEGYIDSTGNLVAAHDAAVAHWGASWRMPTDAEITALTNNCDITWGVCNGVRGRRFTGKGSHASRSIFLPAAGRGYDSGFDYMGSTVYCWSSSPNSDGPPYACTLFDSRRGSNPRYIGQPVRPLRDFIQGCVQVMRNRVTTHLSLDCRTGVRTPSSDGEVICYDASWYELGEEVRITHNDAVIASGVVGSCAWSPASDSSSLQHLLKLEILSKGQVIRTEMAQFAIGYIRNVTAQQLWPHNKVALSFTVAKDIGEVKDVNEELFVWCARGTLTNVATRIYGDKSARSGIHRVIWDMEADGCRLANAETTFGISVEEITSSLGGVQLWEGGPYWAECNVGAAKPEEYGYYFWWGDVVGYRRKSDNSGWISVKDDSEFSFSYENCPTYNKDNSQLQSTGYTDADGNLMSAHDAATAHLGVDWRMPSDAELSALVENCDTRWTVLNGVYGQLVIGRSGVYASRSIFLPAAGNGRYSDLEGNGLYGSYWSSTQKSHYDLFTRRSQEAWGIDFISSYFRKHENERYYGRSVRPIRVIAK